MSGKIKLLAFVAGLGLAVVSGQTKASTIYDITTGTEDGWISTYDNAGAGTVVLNSEQPRSGSGSVKIANTGINDRGRLGTFGSYGHLGNVTAASYDWYVPSTNAKTFLNPFYKLYVTGASLTWQYSDDNLTDPTHDAWQSTNLSTAKFWIRQGGHDYNQPANMFTLSQWASGQTATDGASVSSPLSATTNISGLELGSFTGYSGSFIGYVDNVVLATDAVSFNENFEVP